MMTAPPFTSTWEHVMTPLRQRMIEDLKLRNLAPRTIEVYVQRVAAFARHLGPPEVRSYLVHLVHEKHVSWSYYNQTVAALRFLYRVTLGRDETLHRIACAKQPKKLPVVLSPEEVVRCFEAVPRPPGYNPLRYRRPSSVSVAPVRDDDDSPRT